jgi:ribonuclease VapC
VIAVDTSALFAIAAREDERDRFIDILDEADAAVCSAVTYVETIMVLTSRSRQLARDDAEALIQAFRIEIVPIDQSLTEVAVTAFDRFGKGRHQARLNLADCFAYALAKHRDIPLLFKGSDFLHTDLRRAWQP